MRNSDVGVLLIAHDRRVYRKAVIGYALYGIAISLVVGVSLFVEGELDALVVGLGAAVVALFATVGLAQSLWWRWRHGRVSYLLDDEGVSVLEGSKTTARWAWDDVDLVAVRGWLGWRGVMTNWAEFPRLVIRDSRGPHECRPVLLWGREAAAEANRQVLARASAARQRRRS